MVEQPSEERLTALVRARSPDSTSGEGDGKSSEVGRDGAVDGIITEPPPNNVVKKHRKHPEDLSGLWVGMRFQPEDASGSVVQDTPEDPA